MVIYNIYILHICKIILNHHLLVYAIALRILARTPMLTRAYKMQMKNDETLINVVNPPPVVHWFELHWCSLMAGQPMLGLPTPTTWRRVPWSSAGRPLINAWWKNVKNYTSIIKSRVSRVRIPQSITINPALRDLRLKSFKAFGWV